MKSPSRLFDLSHESTLKFSETFIEAGTMFYKLKSFCTEYIHSAEGKAILIPKCVLRNFKYFLYPFLLHFVLFHFLRICVFLDFFKLVWAKFRNCKFVFIAEEFKLYFQNSSINFFRTFWSTAVDNKVWIEYKFIILIL